MNLMRVRNPYTPPMARVRLHGHRRPFKIGAGVARGHVDKLYADLGFWRVWFGWGWGPFA